MGKKLPQLLDDAKQKGLKAGLVMGQQFICDVMMVCLHRQGWGYDRIKRLLDDMDQQSDYFADAFINCMEQDVRQEQLDREIADIVKDHQHFVPFAERYPNIKTLGYDNLPRHIRKEIDAGIHAEKTCENKE